MEDKIFNNTYGDIEIDTSEIKFEVDTAYFDFVKDRDMHDDIDFNDLYTALDEIITGSQFEQLNKPNKDGVMPKLKKEDISKLFCYVLSRLKDRYDNKDLILITSEYFDINMSKFYSSLSNKQKNELIEEIDKEYNLLKHKKFSKLF